MNWPDVLAVPGFSSAANRRLLNTAVAMVALSKPGVRILEVGSHFGSTAVAMCYDNAVASIHLIDNQSEFGQTFATLVENVHRFNLPATTHSFDYFAPLHPDIFGGTKFDVYHYDGPHAEHQHAAELSIALPHLADRFLYVVDDYSWPEVRRGCDTGLAALQGRVIVTHRNVFDSEKLNDAEGFWNGVLFAWCEKVPV
jgi:hypothetical protein